MSGADGLDSDDLTAVMRKFGVAEEQVRRDHAISHVIAALSRRHRDDLVFFGGTALSRTFLAEGRLSEDIDLIALGARNELARTVADSVSRAILRTHGRAIWDPPWSEHSDVESAVLRITDGTAIRIQLLDQAGYQAWPTELRGIEQRYRDSPPARLRVPTIHSFAAWKTATWFDRHAARDLYDLWGLARIGALDEEAAELFRRLGPTGGFPAPWMFDRAPSEDEWRSQLAAQTRLNVASAEAIELVRSKWLAAVAEFE